MSRTTRAIAEITNDLDRVSGLGGIVSEKLEALQIHVHSLVEDILKNHADASIFDENEQPKVEIDMPYGKVIISTPEEAINFIKDACTDCQHYYECSGKRSNKCNAKKQSIIDMFFSGM